MIKTLLGGLAALAMAAAVLTVGPGAAHAAPAEAPLHAAMACAELADTDFTGIPGAPAAIISARPVAATATAHAYCDVVGFVQPQVQFELKLPSESWNGRYFQTGCGGLCGVAPVENCADALADDFATAAENMGHVGHFWGAALWGGIKELRVDYGARSTHVTAVAAKAILARYYGRAPRFAYFRGCSTGGREGLSEAQHFPADFDGIIVGDPAFAGRLGALSNNWDARQLVDRAGHNVFSAAKLKTLHAAVLKACDGLDGLVDRIVSDPRACHFDPHTLACPTGQDRDDCLTEAQVQSAVRLYDGARDSQGRRLFPGHAMYGSEAAWDGDYVRRITDSYLQYLGFEQNPPPGYTHWDFDFDKDPPAAARMAALYDPVAPYTAPDLHAFHARGGKLILYHGWADQGVSPLASLDYYAKVTAREGGLESTRQWFRAFMVPGMFHCRGGDAPNVFDFLHPMMAWVEHGIAPDGVVATQTVAGKLVRARPLYAYPEVARFKSKGDPDQPGSWTPAWPARQDDDNIAWIWGPEMKP